MSSESHRPSDRTMVVSPAPSSLESIVDDYLQRVADGQNPDQEIYLRVHPEHADALRGIFRTLEFVERTSQSLQSPGIGSGRVLGDFRIIREVGRGGMGVVYEAVQTSLNRKIALKVLPAGAVLSGSGPLRFEREAATAGRLHHTNIVPVHARGVEDGIHFYAMQYIEGRSLADHIGLMRKSDTRTGSDYFNRVAQWGRQAADALQYAHEHGAIHRDIKPSNLLLDDRDVVWLTDFGLARDNCNASMTLSGDVIGTARYMSPEQARGGRDGIDTRTDVYSLGATLYELLTLTPPYDHESREVILNQVAFSDPPAPRKVNPGIPKDLETIVLKCMQKNVRDRYQAAGDIAEDCRRYLGGEPILARRVSSLVKAVRYVRRHRLHVASAVLAVALAVSIVALAMRNRHTRSNALLADAFDAILFEDAVDRADDLLEQAAALGNDSAALHLYHGLIPLLNAQPQRAIADLQEAYRRDPNNAEVCYALAAAYYALGDTINGDRYFQKNEHVPTQSALAWFLRGHALSRIQAPGAIEAFNRAVALRADFTPAIEARAYHRGYRLLTEGAREDLQPMLDDFDAWVIFRPDSPRSYTARASGWMFAAGFAMHEPALRGNTSNWLTNCRRDLDRAAELAGEPDVSILIREGVYDRLIGDFESAARVFEEALNVDRRLQLGRHEGIIYHRSIALYALGRIDPALAEVEPACESLPGFYPLAMQRVLLLAESGRVDEAIRVCHDSMERQQHRVTAYCLTASLLCLLGRHGEAAAAMESIDPDLLDVSNGAPPDESIDLATVRFLQQAITADQLLDRPDATPAFLCEAHLLAALSEFGRGHRAVGRKHLDACVDTGVLIFVEHRLALALRARAHADPNWPAWIE